jgi:glycosyltransferase involved in cell wall biosynthesis
MNRRRHTETDTQHLIEVAHFGNSLHDSGGISSVIRQHVRRGGRSMVVNAHASYRPDARGFVGKHRGYVDAIRALRKLSTDTVVHVHISQGGSLAREGFIVLLSRLSNRPTVVTLHGSSLSSPKQHVTILVTWISRWANVVHVFDDLYPKLFDMAPGSWINIPNDVDVPASVSEPSTRSNQVVFAGEVGLRKGADLLIAAWNMAETSGWVLKVAGPITESVASLFRDGDDSVIALGSQPHSQVLSLLSESRLLLQPSRAEAFPMAVCEALAHGCAVIGTDVGGMGRLLNDSGQTVMEPTADSLANSLQRLLSHSDELKLQADRGREYAQQNLSFPVVTERWRLLYESMLAVRKSR